MIEHPTEKIYVNYDLPVEEFAKLEIKIPTEHITSRTDIYRCESCGESNRHYNDNWDCVRRGHSIRKYSTPNFKTEMTGPFKIELKEGINSSNFPPRQRGGTIDFQVTLFGKHPGVGYPQPKELLEAVKDEGYELADIWQLVQYILTYPGDHIYSIVAAAEKPAKLNFDRHISPWDRSLKGLSLSLLNFPEDLSYVSLALGVKK
ncbi:MAG: hypothetical protein WCV90_01620 [Candidatus Woesearchaeota archaeon]